jgi:ferredoxin
MAYVITKSCMGTLDRACVDVCPVDCIYYINDKSLNDKYGMPAKTEPGMMMINPDECIGCGACSNECPTQAIYEDTAVPDDMKEFVQLNQERTVGMSDADKEKFRGSALKA